MSERQKPTLFDFQKRYFRQRLVLIALALVLALILYSLFRFSDTEWQAALAGDFGSAVVAALVASLVVLLNLPDRIGLGQDIDELESLIDRLDQARLAESEATREAQVEVEPSVIALGETPATSSESAPHDEVQEVISENLNKIDRANLPGRPLRESETTPLLHLAWNSLKYTFDTTSFRREDAERVLRRSDVSQLVDSRLILDVLVSEGSLVEANGDLKLGPRPN